MKILINNLSIDELIYNYHTSNCDDLMVSLARCIKTIHLNNHPNEIVLTGEFSSFMDIQLSKDHTFRSQIRCCSDREAKGIIMSRLSNYIKIDDLSVESIPYSLSIFSNDCWREIITPLKDSSPHLENIKNIPCFYSGELLEILKRAQILCDIDSLESKEIINKKISEVYYNSNFEDKYIRLMRSNNPEKESIIKEISELTCLLNGFSKDINRCKKNGRDIYHHHQKNIYLSVDYLHGTFEIFDQHGSHQFEINCKGEIIEDGDKSRRHDIII